MHVPTRYNMTPMLKVILEETLVSTHTYVFPLHFPQSNFMLFSSACQVNYCHILNQHKLLLSEALSTFPLIPCFYSISSVDLI